MGREIRCMAEIDTWIGEGRLLLETDDLIFRGARRLVVARSAIMSARAENGWLVIDHADGRARFDLGKLAPSWLNAILNPRSRIDKLDVKPGSRVAVLGELDDDFMQELHSRTSDIADSGDAAGYDLIFVRLDAAAELDRLAELRERIAPAGAIWIIHPKGDPALKHDVIAGAARAAGLIDTKSARFSPARTALRLTIPKQQRGA